MKKRKNNYKTTMRRLDAVASTKSSLAVKRLTKDIERYNPRPPKREKSAREHIRDVGRLSSSKGSLGVVATMDDCRRHMLPIDPEGERRRFEREDWQRSIDMLSSRNDPPAPAPRPVKPLRIARRRRVTKRR